MISFGGTGSKVVVVIECGGLIAGTKFSLQVEGGSVWAATLLAEHLRRRLNGLVLDTRAEAYDRGWRDAKAKRRKLDRDCFSPKLGGAGL